MLDVIVDTSVWVEHFRSGQTRLIELLNTNRVLMHPMVLGELAAGSLKKRRSLLRLLKALPLAKIATHTEALEFIEQKALYSKGLSYIDIHLLASATLGPHELWTFDSTLATQAKKYASGH